MKTLQVNVANKVATYMKRSGCIVCGNSNYRIQFTFDAEWADYPNKTARFIWNGQYFDQEFEGDTCPVPMIQRATLVSVGVYAGDLRTTTPASIECLPSILCAGGSPHPETGQHYSNEAKAAAEEAKKSVQEIQEIGDSFSNSLTGTASGVGIVLAEDINPLTRGLWVTVSNPDAVVKAYGKNLFQNDTSILKEITYRTSDGRDVERFGYALALPAGVYTASLIDLDSSYGNRYIYGTINDKNGAFKQDGLNLLTNDQITPRTFTIDDGDI